MVVVFYPVKDIKDKFNTNTDEIKLIDNEADTSLQATVNYPGPYWPKLEPHRTLADSGGFAAERA